MIAKSRLSAKQIESLQTTPATVADALRYASNDKRSTRSKFIADRVSRAYLLVCSLPPYWATAYILKNVYPSAVRDFIIPYGYIPLLFPFWLGTFFLFCWLFLNTGRGMRVSLYCTILFNLILQQVILNAATLVAFATISICIEVVLSLASLFTQKTESVKKRRSLTHTSRIQ